MNNSSFISNQLFGCQQQVSHWQPNVWLGKTFLLLPTKCLVANNSLVISKQHFFLNSSVFCNKLFGCEQHLSYWQPNSLLWTTAQLLATNCFVANNSSDIGNQIYGCDKHLSYWQPQFWLWKTAQLLAINCVVANNSLVIGNQMFVCEQQLSY